MDMFKIMKQAQEMQARVTDAQKSLETVEVTGSSAGGMVEVRGNAKGVVLQVVISDEAMQDKEILEDLVLAAFSDMKAKADKIAEETMGNATKGINLPPGFSF